MTGGDMNGSLEPFDNSYASAVMEMKKARKTE